MFVLKNRFFNWLIFSISLASILLLSARVFVTYFFLLSLGLLCSSQSRWNASLGWWFKIFLSLLMYSLIATNFPSSIAFAASHACRHPICIISGNVLISLLMSSARPCPVTGPSLVSVYLCNFLSLLCCWLLALFHCGQGRDIMFRFLWLFLRLVWGTDTWWPWRVFHTITENVCIYRYCVTRPFHVELRCFFVDVSHDFSIEEWVFTAPGAATLERLSPFTYKHVCT